VLCLLNHGYGAFFQVEGLEFSGKNVWSHITLFNAWVGYMQCITMRIWKLLKEMSVIFNSLASVFFLCVVNVISWSLWAICPGTRQPVMKLPLQHKGKISVIWLQRLIILALIALCTFSFFLQTNNALNMARVILFYLYLLILF
jgi:hypothetical protein